MNKYQQLTAEKDLLTKALARGADILQLSQSPEGSELCISHTKRGSEGNYYIFSFELPPELQDEARDLINRGRALQQAKLAAVSERIEAVETLLRGDQ
jgi:hypothetical protein